MKDFLENIKRILSLPKNESLKLSLRDVHHKGLFSLVIAGNEPGKLSRVFIASGKIKPFAIQLHTHRYPIKLTVLNGNVKHHIAIPALAELHPKTVKLSEFDYKSPLNGGTGLTYVKETPTYIEDYLLPVGASLSMTSDEFHTVSCSTGSMWVVEEGGFEKETSKVLGVPFITEGLYNPPKQFQINDNYSKVLKVVTKLLSDYQTTN